MKSIRSMILVSNDPISVERGAQDVFQMFQTEIRKADLYDEIKLSTISDVGEREDLPLVIIYPEAVIYSQITTEEVPVLFDEHIVN